MSFRITYNSNNIDLTLGPKGLVTAYSQEFKENISSSGKSERVSLHRTLKGSIDMFLDASTYRQMIGWWSWVSRGNSFSIALDSANVANTTLDGAANSGQKVVPLTATTALAADDYCVIGEASGGEFELVKISSVSAGVSITAVDNLVYGYVSGDTFRHRDYLPSLKCDDEEFQPVPLYTDLYRHTITFSELK
jgi:hypothetical protein